MTSELDIYRAAKVLIEQNGADAPAVAAARVYEMITARDVRGRAIWMRILKAIRDLTTVVPGEPRN